MKRFKILIAALFVAGALALMNQRASASSPFIVTVSTVVPNGSTNGSGAFTTAGYPQATGVKKIRQVNITNDGAAERVTLWKNCTSSTAATAVWDFIVPSSTTASNSPGSINANWLPQSMAITSPCIHKGLNGSGTVKASISYE